jgi:restriction endonuclease Mrr
LSSAEAPRYAADTASGQASTRTRDYARAAPKPIALIDGAKLTRLMVQYGVGVRGRGAAQGKVDKGYFERLPGD